MFFGKNPYTGYSSVSLLKKASVCLDSFEFPQPAQLHYKNVTKKTIHYTHHKICKCY